MNEGKIKTHKIIHVDMDCFYAAIEVRDNPTLANKPVAVGGVADRRGVLCTCNYVARQYGLHSAMSTAMAYRMCPDLIVLPVNMTKYRAVAQSIQQIFYQYTDLVEPLALDEAFLDVSDAAFFSGSATLIAKAIREQIWKEHQLTASAGVAPNKYLAKIASAWQKPNGLFVIKPEDIDVFLPKLSVKKLWGVGRVTAEKLTNLGLETCSDLQQLSQLELIQQFGKLGQRLYEQCRGIDHRMVEPNRIRKSLSVERTFSRDVTTLPDAELVLHELFQRLNRRIKDSAAQRAIKNQYIKIKFTDFQAVTNETISGTADLPLYLHLFQQSYNKINKPIRLLGLGVHFYEENQSDTFFQQSLFES